VSERLRTFLSSLTAADRRSLWGMGLVVLAMHVLAFVVLFAVVAPRHFHLGGAHPIFSVGVGVLAYTFGLRHAFDADHIAAVDNTTRKLLTDRADAISHQLTAFEEDGDVDLTPPRRPLSVGFWFSLGHSTIVFALSFLLAVGVRALVGPVQQDSSRLHQITDVIGPSVSGAFLWLLGILNLVTLVGIVRVFLRLRQGEFDERSLERHLHARGFMNRILGGLTRTVRKPWNIYPVGVLFGLGFDTATEVGLLVLAGGAAAFALPWYAILVLPLLFTAAMALFDTIDGVLMNAAYGWAFARPVRKVFYNLAITSLSVGVALVIGTIELVGVLTSEFGITTGPLAAIGDVDLNDVGYVIVGLFLVAWLVAVAVWKLGRFDERWSTELG
jgi:high-affinity nickel-transport protein